MSSWSLLLGGIVALTGIALSITNDYPEIKLFAIAGIVFFLVSMVFDD